MNASQRNDPDHAHSPGDVHGIIQIEQTTEGIGCKTEGTGQLCGGGLQLNALLGNRLSFDGALIPYSRPSLTSLHTAKKARSGQVRLSWWDGRAFADVVPR